jgi:serine/threonine-protein kinase
MSPEQARGDLAALGPRSDVYSLGATLYCLLTGRPPFEGGDPGAVLRAVQSGVFPPPRALDPSLDRALEAVCLKAMAQWPDDRYGTPKALADDVERWMADEPVWARRESAGERLCRWARRNRAWVRAGAAALLAVSVASLVAATLIDRARRNERDARLAESAALRAETSARAAADRRLRQTLRAVEEYYTAVSREVLLGQRPFQALRERLLSRPTAFYEQLAGELAAAPATDESARRLLAEARFHLANVLKYLGRYDESRSQYQHSEAVFRGLLRLHPGDPATLRHLGSTLSNLGLAIARGRGNPEAEKPLEESIAIYSGLVARQPDNPQYWTNLGHCYSSLAIALGRGDPPRLVALHRKAIDCFRRAASDQAGRPEDRADLGDGWNNLASALLYANRPRESADAAREAAEVFSELSSQDPDDLRYLDRLADSTANLANALGRLGDEAGRARLLERSLETRARLIARAPNVPEFRFDLGLTYDNLSLSFLRLRQYDRAVEAAREAVRVVESLAAEFPEVSDYQARLANYLDTLGMAQRRRGDATAAARTFAQVVERFTAVVRSNPDSMEYRGRLGASYDNLGRALADLGRHEEAVRAHRLAIAEQRALLRRAPRFPQVRVWICNHHANLVRCLVAMGRADEAKEVARQSLGYCGGVANALYNAACALALVVPVSPEAERDARAAEAVSVLRRAAAAGLNDDPHLVQNDPDLAALRDRDDFRRLVAGRFDRVFPADPFAGPR